MATTERRENWMNNFYTREFKRENTMEQYQNKERLIKGKMKSNLYGDF